MALSGHDTPIAVISDAGKKSTYTGTLNGVVAGQLVLVSVTACSDSGGATPSGWTVTLGPDTLTFAAGDAAQWGPWGVAAEFWAVATTSGNLTLTVATVTNCRALDAHANLIDGFDQATPIAAANTANHYSSNATSLTAPNAVTPGATGNAILGCLGVGGGGATGMSVTGADGSITGQSGANAFWDHSWCYAYAVGAPPATETFAYSWTGGSPNPRPAAAWVEIKAATGGSSVTGDASGSMPMDGAADGAVDVSGDGAGAMPISGAGAGSVDVAGAGAGAMPITGSGDGTVGSTPIAGDAAGTMPLGGAATGAVEVSADGAGAMPMGGDGAGSVNIVGDGAGSMPLGGDAGGSVGIAGDGAGALPMSGDGSGIVGSVPIVGDAAGTLPMSGTSTGDVDVAGDADGSMPMAGGGTGCVAVEADAAGQMPLVGSGAGTVADPQTIIFIILASRGRPGAVAIGGRGQQ